LRCVFPWPEAGPSIRRFRGAARGAGEAFTPLHQLLGARQLSYDERRNFHRARTLYSIGVE
jgi:hypothetical protein